MPLDLLNAVLLFALSIPLVMKYRILPVVGTPYWLFGILFGVLILNVCIAFQPDILGKFKRWGEALKNTFLILVIAISLFGVVITAMVDRSNTAPVLGVSDIILQQEAAMRYLILGKNPYKETYFGTPMESYHYAELGNDHAINPALYHFVMPPWYLVFPFAFYYTVRPVVGFFDGRMALLFTMTTLLLALWFWFKNKAVARTAIILTALSPAVTDYFIEGRSDMFALAWLILAVVILERKKFIWSAISMTLAILSKQTTWFILPFYGMILWLMTERRRITFWKSIFIAVVVGILLAGPFMAWDPHAFLDSVVLYLNGSSAHSYPVSGYGLGMVLYDAHIISDIHEYYPFVIWQVIFCVPLFILLVRWIWKSPKLSHLMLAYALFLIVFWYMSRYFNNSHLGYVASLLILAALKLTDEAGV